MVGGRGLEPKNPSYYSGITLTMGRCILYLLKVLSAWSSSLNFSKSLIAPHFLHWPTEWSPIIHQWIHKESIIIIPPFHSWVMDMLSHEPVCLTRRIYAWWTVGYKPLINFSCSFISETLRRIRAFSFLINFFLDFEILVVFIYACHSFPIYFHSTPWKTLLL